MATRKGSVTRPTASVKAQQRSDWYGSAGEQFRDTISAISKWRHLKERALESLSLAWNAVRGAALEKYARALSDFAKAENTKADTARRYRTLESAERQERATAERLEAGAREAQTRELMGRIQFLEKLHRLGTLPVWDAAGNMTVIPAPEGFDWDALQRAIGAGKDLKAALKPKRLSRKKKRGEGGKKVVQRSRNKAPRKNRPSKRKPQE